jgi:hydroxybutyrate-dimer hydrolase
MKRLALTSIAAAATLAACFGGDDEDTPLNAKPAFMRGAVASAEYDGSSDDLLTAGLGATGLQGAAPTFANALAPTAAELRKSVIYNNYRALVDITSNGGYMRLYGPNVDVSGNATAGSGKIAGAEYIAYSDDGSGQDNVTLMVQVPAGFDKTAPCIVTATSSGSRGVYGAIATAGDWGLKHNCAVAYSDKGTGNGVHDLQNDTVNLRDGTRTTATAAGIESNFTAAGTSAERSAFATATPNRFAVKHAHSQRNPQKDWGKFTLQAVEFAFYVLNERYSTRDGSGQALAEIRAGNTLVIASSVSNGGASALAAAEQDTQGLIDGVAVGEPVAQVAADPAARIERGTLAAYTAGSKPLYDYFSYANLLQPCAALAGSVAASPFAFSSAAATIAGNRCAALAALGLVTGATTAERADDALARLAAYGWEPDSNLLHASHWQLATTPVTMAYANAYGRFSVRDNRCGYSYASVDATGSPAAPATQAGVAAIFGNGNGVPPSGPMALVYNDSVGGAKTHTAATSPSTNALDFAFDGANCLRQLWTGSGTEATRVRSGIDETILNGNLRGKPALIVHGRADTLVPTNFNSRSYTLRNAQVEGAASKLRYVEVTNAQHFDSFLSLAGYDTRFVPLHVYFNRAMDAMWAHLKDGTPLPGSQVVHTTPRGGTAGAAPANTAAQLPAIAGTPATADAITISGNTLRIPD